MDKVPTISNLGIHSERSQFTHNDIPMIFFLGAMARQKRSNPISCVELVKPLIHRLGQKATKGSSGYKQLSILDWDSSSTTDAQRTGGQVHYTGEERWVFRLLSLGKRLQRDTSRESSQGSRPGDIFNS